MLKEADNKVMIEGILVENNVEEADYQKEGITYHCIRGEVVIRTTIQLSKDDIVRTVEIPVKVFANQNKKDGSPNKLYAGLKKLITDYNSVSAVGEEEADYVRVSNAKIQMNEYVSQNTHDIVSFPQINGLFFQKIQKQNYNPTASFEITFVVANADFEVDRNGEETGKYAITGIVPGYGGKVDVVPFKAVTQNTIDVISTYWQPGDTVKALGKINFSSEVVTNTVESDFGEPQERSYTKRVSELVIVGGKQDPLDEEFAYNETEIAEALKERKAIIEEKKKIAETTKVPLKQSAPARKADGTFDLGF